MKINNIFYVYHLIDPLTNTPFYIGKGYGNRMYHHEKDVLKNIHPNNNSHLFYKIKKVLNNCGKINYKKIIENIDEQTALLEEMKEIKRIGRSNLGVGPLCNLTDGGEGVSGLKFSDETRHKMSLNTKRWLQKHTHPFFGKHHKHISLKIMSEKSKAWMKDSNHRKIISESTKIGMIKSGYIDRVSKSITLKNPDGEIITIKNISKFCRENNLGNANLYKVIRGEIKQHKGWTLPFISEGKPTQPS
jgi:hypothetical protein